MLVGQFPWNVKSIEILFVVQYGNCLGVTSRWTRDCSRINWEEFVRCQERANETYSEAERQFNDRNRVVLRNVQSPHKWWSTFQSAAFRVRHCFRLSVRVVD